MIHGGLETSIILNSCKNSCDSVLRYLANLCLKINLKLGGVNTYVKGGLQKHNVPTIVMGADVFHPSPGSDSCSVSAVVSALLARLLFLLCFAY